MCWLDDGDEKSEGGNAVVGHDERESSESEATDEHETSTRTTADDDGLAQQASGDKQASAKSETSESSAEDVDKDHSIVEVMTDVPSSTPQETVGERLEKAGIRTDGEQNY